MHLLLTVAVEAPLVALVYRDQRLRMVGICAVTTAAANLFMNTIFRAWVPGQSLGLAVGEVGALLLEAVVYALASRPRDVPRALAASSLANAARSLVGLVL